MFYAGFARVDVTPPLGTSLAGYFRVRYADGILDPIELNAVAFSDGENRAVLITADVLYVMENAATQIRGMIAKRLDIPAQNVFMQGLHQHTSIRVGCRPHLGNNDMGDETYRSVLYRKYCDVAQMAMDDLAEATMGVAEEEAKETLSYVRRYLMRDGSCRTNPGRGNPNVVRAMYDADNTVRLIRLKREGKGDIAIANFSTHPDVVSGTKITADWPGFVRRYTEQDLPGVKCILVNGAQGDVNHVDLSDVDKKKQGYAHADHMGRVIADSVVNLWEKVRFCESAKVKGYVVMKNIPTNTSGMDQLEEFRARQQRINAGLEEAPKDIAGKALLGRILSLPSETLFQKVPVSVLCLGEVAFVGFGGEPFIQYAAAARASGKEGKEIYVITACCTNGGQGYLPTVEAFEEGGYEAVSSRFDPCLAPTLQKTVSDILNDYRNECM